MTRKTTKGLPVGKETPSEAKVRAERIRQLLVELNNLRCGWCPYDDHRCAWVCRDLYDRMIADYNDAKARRFLK